MTGVFNFACVNFVRFFIRATLISRSFSIAKIAKLKSREIKYEQSTFKNDRQSTDTPYVNKVNILLLFCRVYWLYTIGNPTDEKLNWRFGAEIFRGIIFSNHQPINYQLLADVIKRKQREIFRVPIKKICRMNPENAPKK